jgi:hypothetical protein
MNAKNSRSGANGETYVKLYSYPDAESVETDERHHGTGAETSSMQGASSQVTS